MKLFDREITPALCATIGNILLLALAASIPYSWSVMARQTQLHCPNFPDNSVLLGTVLALAAVTVLGVSGTGPHLYRRGLGLALIVSSTCGVLAMLLAAISTHYCTGWLYLLTLGPLAGVTTTIGYYSGVTLMIEWFPAHRGFAASWYGGTLGMGSAIFSSFEGWLLTQVSVPAVWGILTAIMLVFTVAPVLFLRHPPAASTISKPAVPQLPAHPQPFPWLFFVLFWVGYFASLAGGWALISALDLIVQDVTGGSADSPVAFKITSGILWAYTLSRFVGGPISDKLGVDACYVLATLIEFVAYILLPHVANTPVAFMLILGFAVFAMGSSKVMVASYIFQHFDSSLVAKLFGHSMSAFGVAGIVGSLSAQVMYTAAENDGFTPPPQRGTKLFALMAAFSALGVVCFGVMWWLRIAASRHPKPVGEPGTGSLRVGLLDGEGSGATASAPSADVESDVRITQLTRSLSKQLAVDATLQPMLMEHQRTAQHT